MGSTYDLNSAKKKLKDSNYQNVGADGQELNISDEDMMKLAQQRSAHKRMNKKMNRKTLYNDDRLTERTRKNLSLDDRY